MVGPIRPGNLTKRADCLKTKRENLSHQTTQNIILEETSKIVLFDNPFTNSFFLRFQNVVATGYNKLGWPYAIEIHF